MVGKGKFDKILIFKYLDNFWSFWNGKINICEIFNRKY